MSQLQSPADTLGETVPSLFVFARLSLPVGCVEARNSWTQLDGHIYDLGFADSWLEPLRDPINRTHDSSSVMFINDLFLTIKAEQAVPSLARIQVSEGRIYDGQMRSDLDYTGFRVSVSVERQTFRLIQDRIDEPLRDDDDEWDKLHSRHVALRIPTKPFTFPPTRGNADPWETRNDAVGQLKNIRRFGIDRIDVTPMSRKPLTPVPQEGAVYDRYKPWLGSTLEIQYK